MDFLSTPEKQLRLDSQREGPPRTDGPRFGLGSRDEDGGGVGVTAPCSHLWSGGRGVADSRLVMFAFAFGWSFIPGYIHKQSQDYVHGKHGNNGSIEVAV